MRSLGGSLKPWEKPWWNGSQNVNLSDFEYSQKGGSILGFVWGVHSCSKRSKVLGKNALLSIEK